ncbi:bifunctional 2-C-methyl-D-erythritol 4-phosphate cytidylyltransferase/2-C-methyl-D-erythritol 2,4-cyclodiphosphate synthase [Paralimibaculum aggregatum]|uniref:Bifunctional enzyme IspD/IspF n=1 Tax=Paralimibaculum aggregatum TaxID=3036245 RepID=A0ABQ6LQ30_9RHOB|nr:2-C-methyl-D-erythritol 2,4-cyclodiphosphate synthase [Limibaculum sp. NKW23]GMG83548.1 bifunctional 2-C-methyl-D-erythritol 4-phosphate cytidylyltransferase/2-C-methyl-D-erythritol 2,4-cyclodiphosphate synthase [Limibaculum sp. NKW23]
MTTAVVIVAAGQGLRLGGPVPKQYQTLGGRAILARSVSAALGARIDRVLVAIDGQARPLYDAAMAGIGDPRLAPPVTGGASRAETVCRALAALEPEAPDVVLVHDAARPFAPPALFEALAAECRPGQGAIAAEPVVDALWHGAGGLADSPRPRDGLWRAQTPQAFPFAELLAAHRAQAEADPPALDDAEVARRAGLAVRLVPGPAENFKITAPADMARAERMLAGETAMDIRMGHGFDVHVFCEGDHVTLCGVRLPHSHGLRGHSDADVGLHALADALYGALGEGDIGTHFPPSEPQWKGAESHIFLAHAGGRVAARGGRIANLDVTLLCERPKIGPHAAAMRARIGEILGLDAGRVSIKATTMERMGFVGREEGMGAIATATVILGGGA